MTDISTMKKMKLRYAGACRECRTPVNAGQVALYDRTAKNVVCLNCFGAVSPQPTATPTDPSLPLNASAGPALRDAPEATDVLPQDDALIAGAPGASARREHERRKNRREQRIRTAHPRLGGIILALSDDPQSTRAWDVGACGEEILGGGLNALTDRGVRTLHDRRIPRTKANIDHIAVTPTGVYVIDAKRYRGQRPTLRTEGGLLRPRVEKLMIGGRDRTKLVAGAIKQVRLVEDALALAGHLDVPVRGMLCFLDADWPLIAGSFAVDSVDVLWPKRAFSRLTQAGPLEGETIAAILRSVATAFPPA